MKYKLCILNKAGMMSVALGFAFSPLSFSRYHCIIVCESSAALVKFSLMHCSDISLSF